MIQYAGNVYSKTKSLKLEEVVCAMADDKDELGIMEDFEWALKDPNDEKIRELGEVVSTVTMKLVGVIGELQTTVSELQTKVGGLEARISQLDSKISSAKTAGPSAPAQGGPAPASKGAAAKAATPPPAAAAPAGAGGNLMGELKSLLSARRKKGDTGGAEGPG